MYLRSILFSLCVLCVLCGELLPAEPGLWGTYRGNPQRTGNTDNQPGPATPAVLWVVKSKDHFVAAPVPLKDGIYLSGLGAFNRPFAAVFPFAAPKMPGQTIWTKEPPYLTLASVSSPALAGDYLVFGDGMHQDSGAYLHCVVAATGKPLWQLKMPGTLIHMEGSPVVAGGKVYIGGGAAGAVCVELDKATLDSKEYDLPTIAKMQEEKWKLLQTKFIEDKKKDPDTAIPPDEGQLLKFSPKKVWQKGEEKWHVDAPLNLAGDKVLVPTAYIEKEKLGERAIYALNAATGDTVWKRELSYNPWGGASVAGDLVIVPCSSVGYYYTGLRGAKGDVTALDLKTGDVKWRKEITGGALSCAAISDDLVVSTATDGKVRAFKLADGEKAWIYDCKMPLFAPPAVAAGVVYVADLAGIVHAIDIKNGTAKWTFSIAKETGAPGMVYGGITVHGGKLIVATCNLEGPSAGKETVIVCLGTK
jgi:outer membrane protein assembly factor BamB